MPTKAPQHDPIDALYGLEPVLEVGNASTTAEWLEAPCPYCGETIGTAIDLSVGSQDYIEDCQVCCQPMLIHLECDEAGELVRGWAERGD